jgi:hypothetical protein
LEALKANEEDCFAQLKSSSSTFPLEPAPLTTSRIDYPFHPKLNQIEAKRNEAKNFGGRLTA